ncbi:alpha/beta-hydrolase [Abortiporus biennis]|nr:alpha/beta-hydrolase [Abortiporus biennis]
MVHTLWRIAVQLSFYAGFLTLTSLSLPSAPTAEIVDLGYAKYLGNRSYPNTISYLGIPYAEPPLGEQRWRAPLPLNTARVQKASGGKVVNATVYPDPCIQGSTGGGDAGGAGSEDCLKVNVYAPVGAKSTDKLPVLVYIHGGGYTRGNPSNWPLDHWVNQVPHVVIVSVYYRLDAFGFLAHPAFSSPTVGDFNVGFLDQTEALRWVQKHIGAFGGDPTRVTINGQSAGGSSIELHLVAPHNEGLFHGAIAQSVYRTPLPTPDQQEPLFDFLSEQAGCGSGSVTAQLSCLRKASISAIARAQDAALNITAFTGPYNVFHPVQDPRSIPVLPTTSILNGDFKVVPLLVGSTSNESLGVTGGSTIPTALKGFFPQLTEDDINEYLAEYPASDFASSSQQMQVAVGESQLICAREIMGGAFAKKANVFTYRYNQPNPTSGSDVVAHAAENWMMFKGTNTGVNGTTTFTPMTPVQRAFAEELIAYWLSFVRSGNPNTFKLARSPTWPGYDANEKLRVVLQQGPDPTSSGSQIETEPNLESQRCVFVASKSVIEQD